MDYHAEANEHIIDEPFDPEMSCQGILAFRDKIRRFGKEDYEESIQPYGTLLFAANRKVVYYDQFSAVLKEDALSKGVDPETIDERIEFFKYEYLIPEDYGIPILNLINRIASDQNTLHQVSVVPLMCGAGKSTAISYKIAEVLHSFETNPDQTDGILIVTDSIERMEEYIKPKSDRNPELFSYLEENRDRIALLKYGDDWKTAQTERRSRPVLIISTQRYFQSSKRRIEQQYLRWDKGVRPLIIFDEHIPIKEVVQIDRTAMNKVASALCDKIEFSVSEPFDEDAEIHEGASSDIPDDKPLTWLQKQWCIEQWEIIRTKIYKSIELLELLCEVDDNYLYCDFKRPAITENDEAFFRYIERNRRFLAAAEGNVIKTIQAVHRLLTKGSICHCQRQESLYESTFSVTMDNTELITDLLLGEDNGRKAKVIILDGTGDVHPDTALSPVPDYIDMRTAESEKFVRWLDMLTIHVVNESTGRTTLSGAKGQAKKKYIRDYLKQLHTKDSTLSADTKPVVFTYLAVEKYFSNAGFTTEHFNNIKGKNDYRNSRLIAQIGMNRLPGWYILSYYLSEHPQWKAELDRTPAMETHNAIIQKLVGDSDSFLDIISRFLLADIEQNMFRSAIRQSDFVQSVHYYIFTKKNQQEYSRLLELMRERYEPKRARIVEEEIPIEFKSASEAKDSIISKILIYLKSLSEESQVSKQDIADGAGLISKEQIDGARKNKKVDGLFKRLKINKSHKFRAPTQEDWDWYYADEVNE